MGRRASPPKPDVCITYEDRNGEITERDVHIIADQGELLAGYCFLRRRARHFYKDRICQIIDLATGEIFPAWDAFQSVSPQRWDSGPMEDIMGDQAEAAGPGADEKKCPDCAEKVKAEARICWRCRYEFRPADAASDKVVPFPGREGALAELLERQPAKPKIYYASDGIEVSAARVLINGSEYPIRNISAFEVQRVIASYGWAIFFWTLTVICALIDFSAVKNGGAAPLFFMAFLFGAIGLLLTHSANEKSGYAILISTGGGQNKALLHKDEAFARTIAAAIGQAVSDYR